MAVPKLRFKAADGSQFPDWEEKTIDEVAECLDNKRVPVNAEERKKRVGVIPYYGAGGIQGYIDDYLFDEELVLLLEDGDAFDDFQTKSIAQYVTGKSWVNNHAHVLRANGNSYFLFASLEHKDIRKWTQLAGASRKKLLKDSMLKIVVNMPSLTEQQKIADFLSTIDTVIEKQKATVEAWEERKKGVMQKLFSQEVRFKADDGSEFPEWEEKILDEEGFFYGGLTGKNKDDFEKGSSKFITYINVYKNIFANQDMMGTVNVGITEKQNKVLYGDILFTQSSETVEEVGLSSVYLYDDEPYLNSFCMGFRFNDLSNVCPKYMGYCMRSENIRKSIMLMGQGISRINLGAKRLKTVSYKIPCLAEQQKIADCLSSLDDVIEKQKATLAAWEEMKKGLLQQMFV